MFNSGYELFFGFFCICFEEFWLRNGTDWPIVYLVLISNSFIAAKKMNRQLMDQLKRKTEVKKPDDGEGNQRV